MFRILLAMISTASLAAFSNALAPAIGAARPTTISVPAGRLPPSSNAGGGQGAGPGGAGTVTPPVLRPGQVLPRGSLLNLSV